MPALSVEVLILLVFNLPDFKSLPVEVKIVYLALSNSVGIIISSIVGFG